MPFGFLMLNNSLEHIKENWDCLIVGGGITGIAIFRDLCLHKTDALLIDKGDFSSQTSQSSSKMLHGGIRYLEKMDFSLVCEALREKNLWMQLTPHLVKEMPFVLPVYKGSKRPLWILKIGMFLYDLLSGFQNTPHKILDKKEVYRHFPDLKREGLQGAGLYYDSVMEDAKMALEVLYDALEKKNDNKALNYVEITKTSQRDNGSYTCLLTDTLTGKKREVSCQYLIFATGPFTDKILKKIPFIQWKDKLLPTKGSHFYLRKDVLKLKHALVLAADEHKKRKRIIFLIPHKEKILVGTTEVDPGEDFFNPKMSPEERDYLLAWIHAYFPKANVSQEDIISTFSGIRPLVSAGTLKTSTDTTRRHKIYQPRSNLFVIIGGKYTTFRIMAQDLVRILFKHKRRAYYAHLSCSPLKKRSIIHSFEHNSIKRQHIEDIINNEFPRTLDDLIVRRIGLRSCKEYHSNLREILVDTLAIEKLYVTDAMKKKWPL